MRSQLPGWGGLTKVSLRGVLATRLPAGFDLPVPFRSASIEIAACKEQHELCRAGPTPQVGGSLPRVPRLDALMLARQLPHTMSEASRPSAQFSQRLLSCGRQRSRFPWIFGQREARTL